MDAPMTEFVCEEVFEVSARGPVMTRSSDVAREARDRGELFKPGDWVLCNGMRARVTGIESFLVPGAPQQGLMLDIDPDLLEPGQVWVLE